jgi:hypothetical protein
LTDASTHAYKSAGAIVEEKMRDHIVPGDFNLPNPDNLIRTFVYVSVNGFDNRKKITTKSSL